MWRKAIIFLIGILLVTTIQISFLGRFSLAVSWLNLFILFLVLLVSLVDFSWTLFFVLVAGPLLDIYSNLPFGVFSLCFLFTALFLEALLLNFFTNRSFYSFVFLGLSATIIYHITLYCLVGLLYLVGLSDFFFGWSSAIDVVFQLVTISILLAFSFFTIDALSNRFKPNFINS